MKSYLMVQNPGVAPEEAFTLLGASTKRGGDNSAIVGKFGTGNKQAVGVLLRAGLPPTVFAGNLKLEFGTRTQGVNDGIKSHEFNRVVVKFGGKDRDGRSRSATEDLGYVLEHGSADWTSTDLALREFVSNAIDRSIEEGEANFILKFTREQNEADPTFYERLKDKDIDALDDVRTALGKYRKTSRDYKDVVVKVVDESQVRAKSGFTRVFVPLNEDVLRFSNNLGKWFLHFSEPELIGKTILPKGDRNLGERRTAVIFRRGVRVREFETSDTPSLFDYNLENLKLDESRRVDDWLVQYEAAQALAGAGVEDVTRLFQAFIDGTRVWESSFSSYGLETGLHRKEQKEVWTRAFEAAAGESAVLSTAEGGEVAARKGYKVVVAPEAFVQAGEKHGVRTPAKVLTDDDRDGREVFDATPDALAAVEFAWDLVEKYGVANGRSKPAVKTFRKVMQGGAQTLGFYREGTVFINQDIAAAGSVTGGWHNLTQQLLVTAFEEVAHHVTGAADFSRDVQDFVMNLIVYLAKERAGV